MIVVDTNIIAYITIAGNNTTLAEKAYQKDNAWIAPLLWQSEYRNTLSLYLRKKLITLEQAYQLTEVAKNYIQGNEFSIKDEEVLQLTAISNCSAYDCEFVALAKDFNLPLLTTDKQILKAFPEIAISLKDFV